MTIPDAKATFTSDLVISTIVPLIGAFATLTNTDWSIFSVLISSTLSPVNTLAAGLLERTLLACLARAAGFGFLAFSGLAAFLAASRCLAFSCDCASVWAAWSICSCSSSSPSTPSKSTRFAPALIQRRYLQLVV